MNLRDQQRGRVAGNRRMRATAIITLLLGLSGCGQQQLEAPLPIAVQVETLRREPITSDTRFSATVREWQHVELSFKVPGTVAALLQVPLPDGKTRDVHEGDVVTNNPEHPLARLDDSDYKRQVAAARERLAQAKAKAKAVQATLTAVEANFGRIKGLVEREAVPRQTFDDVLGKKDAAAAQLAATEREVGAASVALDQALDDLKNCALVSPIDKGVVSRKFIEVDERVQAGRPVFEIMDLSRVRVAFGAPDTMIEAFSLGQKVTVMADAVRGELFTGVVTKVAPAADLRTRTFEVEVTIDNPKQLKPGMVVTIVVGKPQELVLLPMTAVQRGKGPDDLTVYTIVDENGRKVARQRHVKIDGVYDNRVRLVESSGSEVGMGDVIVVTGTFRLVDGQVVRVIDAQQSPLQIGD